ncbi:Snapin [Vigna unguiculata]|uniref:Snapin n=1 Tax=Vigna unguiculata TaxID=3917 RepID=A0A4D6M5E6_VIGUN|nr:Snapin [Vigna unguiculata]
METQENDSVVVEAEPSTSHAPDGDDPLRQSSEVLARGLSSMLSSVITDFDCRANQTLRSQDHLSSVLDRLTGVHCK